MLTPKADLAYLYDDQNLRQALEKMEYHSYTAIPLIDRAGHYVGTLTEGDLLWTIKNDFALDIKAAAHTKVADIPRHIDNRALPISTQIEDVVYLSLDQNFVPVEDDRGIFIGIITRKTIIKYYYELCISRIGQPRSPEQIYKTEEK